MSREYGNNDSHAGMRGAMPTRLERSNSGTKFLLISVIGLQEIPLDLECGQPGPACTRSSEALIRGGGEIFWQT